MPLLIGALVAVLLAAALVFLLFRAKAAYDAESAQLMKEQRRLHQLSSRPVFPSAANVQAMNQQLEIYQEYLDGLYQAMRKGQARVLTVDRDGFRRMLEQGLRRLLTGARSKSVAIAPNLAFGVKRYIEGAAPSNEELPRLVDQFRSIATLVGILYEAGIGELVAVERTVFEEEAQVAPVEEEFVRRRPRGRAEPEPEASGNELDEDPDGLFTREHYTLVYKAQDAVNWKVLDRLSQGAPFAVVTRMEISNPARPAVVLPKAEEEAPAPAPASKDGWLAAGARTSPAVREEAAILPRELRVAAGQELPTVRLEVDIYRFAEAVEAPGEENP